MTSSGRYQEPKASPSINYSSDAYETTPLLAFTVEPPPPPVLINSSGRYNPNGSTSKYAAGGGANGSTGKYVQVPKYPSIRTYNQPVGNKTIINVILLTVMFQSVGFTLVLPSMYLYLKSLGGRDSFYGWIVAIYSVGSFIGSILFGWWSDRRPAKETIVMATIVAIGGNVLYCLISFLPPEDGEWFMLIARFLVGFGGGCVAVCRAYCSEATDAKDKVKVMARISAAQGIGFVIGPGIGSVLSMFSYTHGKLEINSYTSPGYLSALFCLISLVTVLFAMPPVTFERSKTKSTQSESNMPIFVSLFIFFSAVSVFAIFETDFTVLTQRDFGWVSLDNSIYLLVGAVISTITYVGIGSPWGKSLDERKACAVGFVFLILGMLAFIVYDKPVHLESTLTMAQLVIGGVLFSIGYPIASSYIFGLYSKILDPNMQGSKMGWITAAGSLARMLGPIWASNALNISDAVVFGGTALFLVVAMLVLFVSFNILVPHRDYQKQQQQQQQSSA